MPVNKNRRQFLKGLTLASLLGQTLSMKKSYAEDIAQNKLQLKGNIKQSVAYGNFRSIPLDVFVRHCKELGLVGIDLVNPDEWETVMKGGLIVTMSRAPGISASENLNRVEYHDKVKKVYDELIPLAGQAGVKNMICFSGNRFGVTEEESMENYIVGIKRILPLAEKNNVTLHLELLSHDNYQADHSRWGCELARRVGSSHFKILYDIFHMQKMEGNLINNIKKYRDVIGHYHTAGLPGRMDLDDNQEIYYPAVMKAILTTNFKGFVAHEFAPKKENKIESLRDSVLVCDV